MRAEYKQALWKSLDSMMADLQREMASVARTRAELLARWYAEGSSYADLAELTSLSRGRIQQIVESGRQAST